MKPAILGLLLAAAFAAPAAAQDLRDLCPARPGLGTPPCIVDKGHVLAELGIADWTRDQDDDTRTDTIQGGDLLLRYGVDTNSEVQIGWTAYGHQRERDRLSGDIDKASGVGDVTLAYKRSLAQPDGSGFSVALQPFAILPTGGSAIGDGDWSAGLIVPVSAKIAKGVELQLSPEVDAAVDEDRDGRHLSFGTVAGLGIDVSESVNAELEVSAFRDDDPSGHSTEVLLAGSFAWQPSDAWQLDVGSAFGLNADSPDARLYVGIARRF
ncbi:MAG: transporter [Sphingobium sp.]